MINFNIKNIYHSTNIIRFVIIFYWSLYWLFNIIDKIIAASQFLWVGKDRFAQFQRFFASAGWENPMVANTALIIVAGLEIFAFIFFAGAFIHLFQKKEESSRTFFVVGISLTLATFTIFSIGDHIFGDRFELLEHTLFWILTLFTWVIFIHSDKLISIQNTAISKKQVMFSIIIIVLMTLIVNISIFNYKNNAFHLRKDSVSAQLEGENLYKLTFPFLAGSTSFEKSLEKFKKDYPDKKIKQIYTVPDELKKQQADALIVYITTEDKK
jgi:hypothetical protein